MNVLGNDDGRLSMWTVRETWRTLLLRIVPQAGTRRFASDSEVSTFTSGVLEPSVEAAEDLLDERMDILGSQE